jgi:hypothetical protein
MEFFLAATGAALQAGELIGGLGGLAALGCQCMQLGTTALRR